jgi:hypothetical protein
VAVKFEIGTKLYEAGKYKKAIRLFRQITPTYRGKELPQAEKDCLHVFTGLLQDGTILFSWLSV